MGTRERILAIRILQRLEEHPQWGWELGLEWQHGDASQGSEEKENRIGQV